MKTKIYGRIIFAATSLKISSLNIAKIRGSHENEYITGICKPHFDKSHEYSLGPTTLAMTVPPRLIKKKMYFDTNRGM